MLLIPDMLIGHGGPPWGTGVATKSLVVSNAAAVIAIVTGAPCIALLR